LTQGMDTRVLTFGIAPLHIEAARCIAKNEGEYSLCKLGSVGANIETPKASKGDAF